jgi:predicted ester cyclase
MSSQDHSHFVERLTALFNMPDVNIADEIMMPQFVSHVPLAPALDLPGWKAYVQSFYTGFPDLQMETHDVLSCGDQVALRVTYRGTHTGPFQGVPATGRSIAITAIGWFRLANGRGLENWAEIDVIAMMQQIGAIPAPTSS